MPVLDYTRTVGDDPLIEFRNVPANKTWGFSMTFTNTDDGTPMSLAGKTVRVTIKEEEDDVTNVKLFSNGNGLTVVANKATIPKIILPAGNYFMYVDIIDGAGNELPYAKGIINAVV